jgi:hypothetical protein
MSWMQGVRDGTLVHRPLFGCLLGHRWRVHQHNFNAEDNARVTVVIAWKQCAICAKSKLIHILK